MRPHVLAALSIIITTAASAGCAMSPAAYGSLAAEVGERNQERYDAALEAFRAEGYEMAPEAARFASLDEAARQRCIDARYADATGQAVAEAPASDEIRFTVVAATMAGGAPSPALEFSAPADDVCAFFSIRTGELEGVDAAGENARVVSIGGETLARSSAGDLVYVDVRVHVVSSRTVLVEDTCNEMPDPGPDPLDRAEVRVLFARAPTERVQMTLEREELDYECTEVVE